MSPRLKSGTMIVPLLPPPPRTRAVLPRIVQQIASIFPSSVDLSHIRRVWIIVEQMLLIPHDPGLVRDGFIDAVDRRDRY